MAHTADRPTRTTRRREQTRSRLLDAAFTVFAARGFGHVRIEDVCAEAGFTRGAFYSNFASLDELFFALYEQRSAQLVARVGAALEIATGSDEVPDVRLLVEQVVEALAVDRDWVLVKTDFALHAARRPELNELMAGHRRDLRAALVGPLTPVAARAELPAALRDPDRLARAVSDVHDGVMTHLLDGDDDLSVRRWLTNLLTALLVR
jgi:AcrR family transcriptional regulator